MLRCSARGPIAPPRCAARMGQLLHHGSQSGQVRTVAFGEKRAPILVCFVQAYELETTNHHNHTAAHPDKAAGGRTKLGKLQKRSLHARNTHEYSASDGYAIA